MPGIEQLARALSEEERRKLFAKIRSALSADGDRREHVIHTQLRDERRKELIKADMRGLGPWERLYLWFKRIFSRSSEEALFLDFRLSQVRGRVYDARPDLVDFEHRHALPGLARTVGRLYLIVQPLVSVYQTVWRDTESLRAVVDRLFAARIPDAKRSLNEFCTIKELQDEYRRSESRSRLKQIVLDKIGAYLRSIPESVMEDVKRGVMPLYTFRDLILYDYSGFFARFKGEPPATTEALDRDYATVDVTDLLPAIEALYLALHSAGGSSGRPVVYVEAFGDTPGTAPAQIRDALHALGRYLRSAELESHLGDIIRVLRGDPYYRFVSYTPRVLLQDFYYASLKVELLAELDLRFSDIRVGVLGELMQELFHSETVNFEFFDAAIEVNIKRAGLGPFVRHRALQIINTFLTRNYHDGLAELLRTLPQVVPTRLRRAMSIVPVIATAIDDVTERLRQFDAGFSPSADEGRALRRILSITKESDNAQVAALQALVAQKDREAGTIIQKFHDAADLIVDTLRKVQPREGTERNAQSAAPIAGDERLPAERIEVAIERVETCKKLVNQIALIEL